MYKDVKKRRENQSKWIRKNTKGFYIRLSLEKDADIIEHLGTKDNKQGYVKSLIRKDIIFEKIIEENPYSNDDSPKFVDGGLFS